MIIGSQFDLRAQLAIFNGRSKILELLVLEN